MAPNPVSPTVETLSWLLEPDSHNPGVRYFALRDLLDQPPEAPEMIADQTAMMQSGSLPAIQAASAPPGYWVEPGAGYHPKYTGAVWQIIFLAQLGAAGRNPRVQAGCEYILDHVRSPYGGFSAGGNSGLIHCLRDRCAANPGSADCACLWRRCAPASDARSGAEQVRQAGALEAGVHLQRQDVGGY